MALTEKLTNIADAIRTKTGDTETYTLIDMVQAINDIPQGSGGTGEDGGYYTPVVTQPNENSMVVSFNASKDGMPELTATTINLPAGPKGQNGSIGPQGEDGGYYTPIISQLNEETMTISFSASNEGMPEISSTTINLPSGGGTIRGITSINISEV